MIQKINTNVHQWELIAHAMIKMTTVWTRRTGGCYKTVASSPQPVTPKQPKQWVPKIVELLC